VKFVFVFPALLFFFIFLLCFHCWKLTHPKLANLVMEEIN